MLLWKAFFSRTKPPDELLDLCHSRVEVRPALGGGVFWGVRRGKSMDIGHRRGGWGVGEFPSQTEISR